MHLKAPKCSTWLSIIINNHGNLNFHHLVTGIFLPFFKGISMAKTKSKLNLQQGSPEWHEWRRQGIGGSDAPAVMGISPYKTALQLWREKTGISEEEAGNEFIFAMGHRVEEKIRRDFIDHTGVEMVPVCMVHPKVPYFRASLDGFNKERGVLEAKLVGAKALAEAKLGIIVPHHLAQMQHQFMVSGADRGDYFCHNGKDSGVLLQVEADPEFIKILEDIEHEFWDRVTKKIAPPLTPRDYFIPEDPEIIESIRLLKDAKEIAENSRIYFEELKEKLLPKLPHPKVSCLGLKIFKVERKGNINYSKIPEFKDLSEEYLEKYRGKPSESWTIQFEKSKGA